MTKDTRPQQLYQSQEKVEELESIRGLAALLVVFFHIPKWNTLLDIGIINNGYLMVDLFFVLSGYVIYTAYEKKITNKKDLFRFQILRLGRLYPVHFIFLVSFIFIEIVKYVAQSKFGMTSIKAKPFEDNNLAAFLQQLFLVQAMGLAHNALTFNYPAWSVSVEFYTYLLFGVCILFSKKNKDLLFFLIALISVILLANQKTFEFNYLFRCLAGFFIGCLTALGVKKLKLKLPKYVSLLAFSFIVFFLQLKTTKQYDISMYFLTAALIVSLVRSTNGYLNYVLNIKVLTWLGSISYSVYMSHVVILWIMEVVIRRILEKPEIFISKKLVSQLNNIETLIACGVLISVILSISVLVNRFIEKPMREKSRHFASLN